MMVRGVGATHRVPWKLRQRMIPCLLGAWFAVVWFGLVNPIQETPLASTNQWHKLSVLPPRNTRKHSRYSSVELPPIRHSHPQTLRQEERQSSDIESEFFWEHCHMDAPTQQNWWPSSSSNDWRLRTPEFLLAGIKKAGTTTLWHWLSKHPQIVPGRIKESLFFMPRRLPPGYWSYDIDAGTSSPKAKVDLIRRDMYRDFYPTTKLQQNNTLRSFEGTPDYILFSTLSRIPILCAFPWVKLLVVLRDPIERAVSNFHFMKGAAKRHHAKHPEQPPPHFLNQTFEAYIQADIQRLQKWGVLPVDPSTERIDPTQERLAWTKYQIAVGQSPTSPIGRSLYVLQLEEWRDGLRALGRNPETEWLWIRNEDMRTHPRQVLRQVEDFLGLSVHGTAAIADKMVTQYQDEPPLSDQTRARLEKLFAPYNERLYKLLGWDQDFHWF